MDKVFILGGAQTDFERNWSKEGKNVIALLRESINDAFKNTNLDFDEIKRLNKENKVAFFIGNFIAEEYISQGHLGALMTEVNDAFYGVPSARYEAACASGSAAIDAASTKIRVGDYDLAIVIGFELMKTVDSKRGGDILGKAAFYQLEAKGIEYPFPKLFGQLIDVYIDKYKADENRVMSALARISAKNYSNAKRNGYAQTRKWFMNLEHANNRNSEFNPLIGNRLAISDCSQITDGAAVVVLASEKFVKDKNITNKPVIKGFGHRVAPMTFESKIKDSSDNAYILPWTKQAIDDAYNRSNLSVDDIDFFETHDCFTSSEYCAISAFGITKPGYEYEAVESGIIEFHGSKPINPSGGLIGGGHPVGATGVRMMLDLYKQISGTAGKYQIKDSKNGMMLNIGGTATSNFCFVVGKEDNK